MLDVKSVFSGFSINDVQAARAFYADVLGLKVEDSMGGIRLHFPSGHDVYMYQKDDHKPATYTVLNLVVGDIDEAVDTLRQSGISFERYAGMEQDEKGIMRGLDVNMGPNIAWFKDPAGNILAILQQ